MKYKKVVEGYSPYPMLILVFFSFFLWMYAILGFEYINVFLYVIGMFGNIVSIYYVTEFFCDRKVFWERVGK